MLHFKQMGLSKTQGNAQNATTPDSQQADVMANRLWHRLEEGVSWRKQRPAEH